MDRVQADLRVYRRVRSVADPMFLVSRTISVTVAELGQEARDPTRITLLRRAFAQSRHRLSKVSSDAEACTRWHAFTSLKATPKNASIAAALAYRSHATNPLPLITLAGSQMVDGKVREAKRVGEQAALEGATYANELLAALVLRSDDRPIKESVDAFERLRSRVTPEGCVAYLGFRTTASEIFEGFTSSQGQRTALAARKAQQFTSNQAAHVGRAVERTGRNFDGRGI
jgi:hypothetical protein